MAGVTETEKGSNYRGFLAVFRRQHSRPSVSVLTFFAFVLFSVVCTLLFGFDFYAMLV